MTRTPDEIKMSMKRCNDTSFCLKYCSYRKLDFPECVIAKCDDIISYNQKLESCVPRWISVKERLPEEGELVVFIPTINQGSIYVGKLSHTGARGGVLFENRQGRTTMKYYAKYWMPLPEPPKEE